MTTSSRPSAAKGDFVTETVQRDGWDLLTVVFGEGHCAGHQFWALHDPEHPRHDVVRARALGDPMIEVYTELDAALGHIVSAADADTLVLVVLSHGMGPHYDASFLLGEMLQRIEDVDGPPRSAVGGARGGSATRGEHGAGTGLTLRASSVPSTAADASSRCRTTT